MGAVPELDRELTISGRSDMKLYDWDFAPNCRRVRMFILEYRDTERGVHYF